MANAEDLSALAAGEDDEEVEAASDELEEAHTFEDPVEAIQAMMKIGQDFLDQQAVEVEEEGEGGEELPTPEELLDELEAGG